MTEQGRPMARRAAQIFRHFVFMMIGALLAVPYFAVFTWATQLAAVSAGLASFAFGILFVLLAVPALLPVTRELERTAVRELLSVDLPGLPGHPGFGRRWRGAAWYLLHLLSGALLLLALVVAGPVVLSIAFSWLAGRRQAVAEVAAAVVPFANTTAAALWAVGLGLAVLVFTVLTGSALPHWARSMLGPSAAELAALDEERAREAARRNGLARELHDSVGHALTVTTLQATAAQGLLARDPAAAARAMQAVADTGRAALAELDRVIGILRSPAPAEPAAGLEELGRVLAGFAGQGLQVEHHDDGEGLSRLPRDVSAAALRILQEGLTNALKYARPQQARLRIRTDAGVLLIRLSNPVLGWPAAAPGAAAASLPPEAAPVQDAAAPGGAARGSAAAPAPPAPEDPPSTSAGGRGLDGIRERARLFGGTAHAVLAGREWILEVDLPAAPAPVAASAAARRGSRATNRSGPHE
jgi:signal transduction histidine kinase